jgi:hypothetical protein
MLVGVNQELSKILEKLDAISAKLDNLNNKTKLGDTIQRFNYVRDRIAAASEDTNNIAKDFKRIVPKHIDQAAQQISFITDDDFDKLEGAIGEDGVNELQTTFHQINLLAQNINANRKDANPQDANQAAETSKKKKSPSTSFFKKMFSTGGEDESGNEAKSNKKKKVSFVETDPTKNESDLQNKHLTVSGVFALDENEDSAVEKHSSKKKYSNEKKESPEKKESTKKNANTEAEASSDSSSKNSDSAAKEITYKDLPMPTLIPYVEETKPQ